MKVYQLTLLVCFVFHYSCKDDDPIEVVPQSILKLDQTLVVDDITRTFHIQFPDGVENIPLVILLHGHGGSSNQSLGLDSSKNPQRIWLDIAEREEFIVVVPNGEIGPEGNRGWNDCRTDAIGNPSTDDVKYIRLLLDELAEEYNYDQDRVYVTGISTGALMTQRLVQEIPERIAAFGAIVNSLPENSSCIESDITVSALYMNGTADPLVPYGGGQISSNRGVVKSTDESIQYWIERNQTDQTPTTEIFEDVTIDDSSSVEKYTYANGLNNSEVVLYKIVDGGHTEPSLVENYGQLYLSIVGIQNEDIEMAEEVWAFFENKNR